ncbi:MAG: colicin V production protein [Acidobacteria bacterium]|nr:MAG: colicin V production protein [Acidobacteriota bacterium]
MAFNVIDILLVLLVILSMLSGYRRGLILGVLDLASWVLSLLAGLRFYQPVARWLAVYVHSLPQIWNRPIAFILIAVMAGLAVHLVGNLILRRLPKDIHQRRVNRLFGIIPGFANGLITAAIVSALLLAIPLNEGLRERARASASVNRLAVYTERLEAALHPVFGEAIAETLNLLTIRPESNERVTLPYTVAAPQPRPELEARMLELVNGERVAAGLRPLAPDPELTQVARQHSADMFARGYFAHATPEGRDPFERMREANVRFLTAGENLALAPTLQIAHTGLMNSPGHRANILQRDFGRVGIGIMDGRIHGLMVTQDFRN